MAANNEIAIEVENLTKKYNLYNSPKDRLKEALHPFRKKYHHDFYALKDVSFEIKKGETVGIIGNNGSGKSTLLKILTGVLTPSAGSYKVKGKVSSLLELGTGFNPELTGLENVYFNGTLLGFSKEEMNTKLDEILAFADIGEYINQPVKMYSSGMYVRLAFAVATSIDPEILIVDEALSVGYVYFQVKCFDRFEKLKKDNKTILFVSHDIGSIVKYCDKAILLNNGKVEMESEPVRCIEKYKESLSVIKRKRKIIKNDIVKNTNLEKNINRKNDISIEYGNMDAEIFSVEFKNYLNNETTQIMNGDIYTVNFKIVFNNDIINPIFGFFIRDLKGTEITGINTDNMGINNGIFRKGDSYVVNFKQNMNLQQGDYFLSIGVSVINSGEIIALHRLYNILTFSVISKRKFVGIFDPYSTFEIKRNII